LSLKDIVSRAYSYWMDGTGPEAGLVISSRVRLARNLAEFPFPHLLSVEQAEQVIHAVNLALQHREVTQKIGKLELIRMGELTAVERNVLVEKHLISPDLLRDHQKKAVVLRDDEVISIMVNEEDHLRLQVLLPGLQLREAWRLAAEMDDLLERTLNYAFNERLGYLTACPTNVGTGLRASVMLHLPGLVLANQIESMVNAVAKLGLTARGLYGEGTEATGNLFQVSNQVTLGQAEEEMVANLTAVTGRLLAQERAARQALYRDRREVLEDRIWRSYGILKSARVLSSEETMRLLSDVRLGVDLRIIDGLNHRLINELMVMTRPAFLMKLAGREMPPHERDVFRARLVRDKLKQQGG
jgi:protein arginine kinase